VSTSSASAACSDVEVVFARGSGELPGLGIVGGPVVNNIKRGLPGKSVASWAVTYAADVAQTSAGPGATALTNHVVEVARQCPGTKFVLGGYSQGASVVDIALGIPNFLGVGKAIPAELHPRIAAILTFGNPLALTGGKITNNRTFGARAKEFCNLGDPVCGAGVNVLAHITYGTDGSAAQAAQFAIKMINGN
jgi:cutinase